MKIQYTKCDICEKHFTSFDHVYHIKMFVYDTGWKPDRWDICSSCWHKMKNWILIEKDNNDD